MGWFIFFCVVACVLWFFVIGPKVTKYSELKQNNSEQKKYLEMFKGICIIDALKKVIEEVTPTTPPSSAIIVLRAFYLTYPRCDNPEKYVKSIENFNSYALLQAYWWIAVIFEPGHEHRVENFGRNQQYHRDFLGDLKDNINKVLIERSKKIQTSTTTQSSPENEKRLAELEDKISKSLDEFAIYVDNFKENPPPQHSEQAEQWKQGLRDYVEKIDALNLEYHTLAGKILTNEYYSELSDVAEAFTEKTL